MSNPFSYEGKRVILTGGATGVGAALLELLAEIGAPEVTVIDLKPPTGPHATYIATNLSERGAVDAAIKAISGPVNVLFNNAGVNSSTGVRTTISVNYLALRKLSEGLLDKMAKGGAIVNTASIAGGQWPERLGPITELIEIGDWDKSLEWVESHTDLFQDAYGFSKEIVQVWTMRSSRASVRSGVRTNSVCPAPIDTPLLKDFRETMTDKLIAWTVEQSNGRPVTGREVALVLAFLGSDAAAYVNGVNMLVDAGFTAAMTTGQVDFAAIS